MLQETEPPQVQETNVLFEIDSETRKDLAAAIWSGSWNNEAQRRLDHWFQYYADEIAPIAHLHPSLVAPEGGNHRVHDRLIAIVDILNRSPGKSRQELTELLHTSTSSSPDEDAHVDDWALDLVVRMVFLVTPRSSAPGHVVTTGQIFRPSWSYAESLENFLARTFPLNSQGTRQSLERWERIHLKKLTASYLERYADIEIEWTVHLPDHLTLERTANGKYLHVFSHTGFLEQCLARTQQCADEKAISRCLSQELVGETLRSLEMLFPPHERRSRAILNRGIKTLQADPRLLALQRYQQQHESPGDALQPTDVDSLYQKFPHWGERLYELWLDADDPAPVSKLGWWSESKKSPRSMYWAGVLALTFAVFFGILASVFSALQVWISYCAWKNNPELKACQRWG
ncbi:hypothetical protein BT63DRAFT_67874 [Microthyrium microscopicum]|uniref:Uncharacterized protein n=1 Tax=Microthyrium microscopicum TaxID=703497 RepID=A0A6A6U279_9PEZI|nr:hypothetical protein BT63DRAFT_67874 [Microthyrium microscopicum]